MEIVTQLSVFVENKPGTLSAICEELAKEEINIYGLTVSDTTDHAVVRMVVSDPKKALHIFEQRGVLTIDNKVLMIEMSNHPGGLASIAKRLSKAKINIEYAYSAASPSAKTGLLIIRASETKEALKVLSKKNDAKKNGK
jgi:hypothetical protein